MHTPTAADASDIVRQVFGTEITSVERFPTGHCHYVYEVVLADGRPIVARLAGEATRAALAGGIYWHDRLLTLNLPLPKLFYADLDTSVDCAVMLLEHLPGRDLAYVYDTLTSQQKRTLATEIVAIQRRVATLPAAAGFGFAHSYDDANLYTNWLDVVLADVERSRQRILAAGVVDVRCVERVYERVQAHAPLLHAIEPQAFLDDLTTKNVLIDNGALSGIVDTDYVCFGDALFTVALTRLALLAHNQATDYIDYWCEQLSLTSEQEKLLHLYTAVFCVGFLSEIGQQFNKDAPAPIDNAYLQRLEHILAQLLS